jgi:hypothetical protein
MKPLLDILFRWAIALTIGSIVMLFLMLLALIMWDGEFLLMAHNMKERILYDNQNK